MTTQTITETTYTPLSYIETIAVGRTVDNGRAYLTLELSEDNTTRQTVTHDYIHNPITLSICGNVQGPRGYDSGGQNREEFTPENMNQDRMIVSMQDLARIVEIWDRWHLNTMKGECCHQDRGAHVDREGETTYPDGWFTSPRFEEVTAAQTAKCPVGYKYGSAWLTEPLPESVIEEITGLFDKYAPMRGSL